MRSSLTRGGWALVLVLAGCVTRRPHTPTFPNQVHDVSRLNPVSVAGIVQPTSTEQIAEIIRGTSGPISIGGSRHSMGGQTAAPGAVQLDMRRFNRILAFDSAAPTITVQAGITWRQIQARIDSANLAVKIMQSYANFTVGGSLSVNAHGRCVGLGAVRGARPARGRGAVIPDRARRRERRRGEPRHAAGDLRGGDRRLWRHRRHPRRDARSRRELARASQRPGDATRGISALLRREP